MLSAGIASDLRLMQSASVLDNVSICSILSSVLIYSLFFFLFFRRKIFPPSPVEGIPRVLTRPRKATLNILARLPNNYMPPISLADSSASGAQLCNSSLKLTISEGVTVAT